MRGLPTHRGAVCLGKRTLRIHLLTDHLGNFTDSRNSTRKLAAKPSPLDTDWLGLSESEKHKGLLVASQNYTGQYKLFRSPH
jgi:hypothetical protein